MSKKSKKLLKRVFALMLALVIAVPTVDYSAVMTVNAAEEDPGEGVTAIDVSKSEGYEEGAYVTWSPVEGADGYQVYVSDNENAPEDDWTLIDDELIREYPTYYRADVLELTPGTWYVKVVAGTFDASKSRTAKIAETEEPVSVTVTSHDRSGFAWQGYGDDEKDDNNINTPGAYKKDGTLKDDTNVIYVTNATKNRVTLKGDNDTEYVGLTNILGAYKQKEITKPLDVRIIGNVTDMNGMDKGDVLIENGNSIAAGITIEGIGEDAVANGWGIRLDNASNIEIRNLGFMNCDSAEGDNVSAERNNEHVWVHNCDFFYGMEGSDDDQKKGDGMIDCKESDWMTFSYNHFWDSGKSSLLGLQEGSDNYHATYHHNWFDHSDSRHPRVRYYTTHVYNNYYDGNSKYGIGGAQGGASIFAENNYFRNCKYPMLISMQGSETGGTLSREDGSIIKAFGNIMVGNYTYKRYPNDLDASTSLNSETGFIAFVALDDEISNDIADVIETVDEDTSDVTDIKENLDSENDIASDESNVEDASADNDNDPNLDEDTNESSNENETSDSDEGKSSAESESSTDNNEESDEDEISDINIDVTVANNVAAVEFAADSAVGTTVDFDAYEVSDRYETVPDEVVTKQGGNKYNNFDTAEGFYEYTPDEADKVPEIVEAKAGRLGGGDLKWTFNNATDDDSSDVDKGLKEACTNYKTQIVSIGGIQTATVETYYTVTLNYNNAEQNPYTMVLSVEADTGISEPSLPKSMTVPSGKKIGGWYSDDETRWNFRLDKVTSDMTLTARWIDEDEDPDDGLMPITETKVLTFISTGITDEDSLYFDAPNSPDNYDTKSGSSGTYTDVNHPNGISYKSGGNSGKARLNLEVPSSVVKFRTASMARVVLFLNPDGGSTTINMDNVVYTHTAGIVTTMVMAGSHTITPGSNRFLFAVMVEPIDSSTIFTINVDMNDGSENTTTLEVNAGSYITSRTLPNPTREGYMFNGWEDTNGNLITLPYMPLGDMTIRATWYDGPAGVDMELLASDIEAKTYTEDVEQNGFIIKAAANSDVVVDTISNVVNVNDKSYTARINTRGSGNTSSRSIKFDTAPFATLEVVCQSSSSSADRKVAVANLVGNSLVAYSGEIVREDSVKENYDGGLPALKDSAHSYTLKLAKAGTYYIYSPSSGVYIYAVRVTYENSQESESFTVTFDTDGGSPVASQTVNNGEKCTKPDDPTKKGFTFGGWYTDSDCTDGNEFNFDTTTITDNITLYAKWIPSDEVTYTVTFNTDGGSSVASQTVNNGEKCTKPDDPTKEGFTFGGWYTDSACTKKYNFNTPVTANITLYAKWTSITGNGEGWKIILKETECTYTGSAVTPEYSVTYDGKPLIEGIDYTVKYSNNIKVSKNAKITVTGKGNLSGNTSTTFSIEQKALEFEDTDGLGPVEGEKVIVTEGSKASVVLSYGGIKLTTKDFDIKTNKDKKWQLSDNNSESGASITIEGKGNFKGTRSLSVIVIGKTAQKDAKIKVTLDAAANKEITYTGNPIKLTKKYLKVTNAAGATDLEEGKDYEVTYTSDITSAGKKKFTVIGTSERCVGTVTKTYTIKPAPKNGTIEVLLNDEPVPAELPYVSTGVTFDQNALTVTYTDKANADAEPINLNLGTDYKITYSANKKVGTAKYTITGLGNYKGIKTPAKTFKIVQAELNKTDFTVILPDKAFTKPKAFKSTPYVIETLSDGSKALLKSSNYKVTYYDETGKTVLTEAKEGDTVSVKIEGKGNYKGIITETYKVKKAGADLSTAKIEVYEKAVDTKAAKKLSYTGEEVKPAKISITLKGKSPVTLTLDEYSGTYISDDYDVTFANNKNKGKATVIISAKTGETVECAGGKTATFSIVAKSITNMFTKD